MEDCYLFHESVLEYDLQNWCNKSDNVAIEIHCVEILDIGGFAAEDDFPVLDEACIKADQNVNYQYDRQDVIYNLVE